jgi:DNA-binding transcriptional regulator YhcF (GntR family)
MRFDADQPIYKQISDLVCENIMLGRWPEESRIPSIRELAVETEVNPNTVVRSYGLLQDLGIIQNRRGLGYFVAPGGRERTRRMLREDFLSRELPRLFRSMSLLGIEPEELADRYGQYSQEELDR